MTDSQKYEIATRLGELHDEKTELQARLKELNAEYDELEAELVNALISNESGSFNHKGRNFVLVKKTKYREVAERRDELYAKLKKRKRGNMFTVPAGTLNKEVNAWVEELGGQLPTWLKGLVSDYAENTISIRKGRKV
jgi:predicted nuclease with TOPRIM domain